MSQSTHDSLTHLNTQVSTSTSKLHFFVIKHFCQTHPICLFNTSYYVGQVTISWTEFISDKFNILVPRPSFASSLGSCLALFYRKFSSRNTHSRPTTWIIIQGRRNQGGGGAQGRRCNRSPSPFQILACLEAKPSQTQKLIMQPVRQVVH